MTSKRILFGERLEWKDAILQNMKDSCFEITFQMLTNDLDYSLYDLVIPLSIHDQLVLNKIVANKNIKIKSIFASNNIIDLTNDKHLFNQFLIENSFGKNVPAYKKIGEFPYILKKRIGEFGVGCYIINNIDDEAKFIHFIKDESSYYIQDLVKGEKEYTTHIAFKNGIIFNLTFEFTYYNDVFIKGQGTIGKMARVIDSPFTDLWDNILKKINFEGIGCFNYKIVDGKPLIFEFNPRFGSSLTSSTTKLIKTLLSYFDKNDY